MRSNLHKSNIVILLITLLFVSSTVAGAEPRQWIPGWQAVAGLNVARAGAAVVKTGHQLYVIGGVDGHRFLRSVEYTTINADGSLAPWQLTSGLLEERGFFAAVVSEGYLYVVGGGNGDNGKHLLQSVERAAIQADGSLGPWQSQHSALVYPRRCVKLLIQDRRLYALGGFAGTLLDSVESAALQADGSLGPWRLEPKTMTMPRYVNAAKQVGDLAIVIGGHREIGGVGLKAVEVARLSGSGVEGDWQATAAMHYGRYGLSAASDGQFVWAIGGLDGAIYTDRIEKTTIKQHGPLPDRLGNWQDSTSLSSPRANTSVVVDNGRMYIIGGTNRDGYYNSVESALINEHGDPGFYGSAAEAHAYQQRNAGRTKTILPNAGNVIEIIQTSAYTYLKVSGEAGARWLAAPKGDYKAGDAIRYSRGLTMSNFYSRSLERKFDEILFVERIEKD
jgi:hypothetical protein